MDGGVIINNDIRVEGGVIINNDIRVEGGVIINNDIVPAAVYVCDRYSTTPLLRHL